MLAILYLSIVGADYCPHIINLSYRVAGLTVVLFNLIFIIAITLHWIFSHKMIGLELFRKFRAFRKFHA